jgi:hypothetical protein
VTRGKLTLATGNPKRSRTPVSAVRGRANLLGISTPCPHFPKSSALKVLQDTPLLLDVPVKCGETGGHKGGNDVTTLRCPRQSLSPFFFTKSHLYSDRLRVSCGPVDWDFHPNATLNLSISATSSFGRPKTSCRLSSGQSYCRVSFVCFCDHLSTVFQCNSIVKIRFNVEYEREIPPQVAFSTII